MGTDASKVGTTHHACPHLNMDRPRTGVHTSIKYTRRSLLLVLVRVLVRTSTVVGDTLLRVRTSTLLRYYS